MGYATTGPRMALGLAGGAFTGAALFCLYLVLAASPNGGGGSWLIVLLPFIYSAVIWLIGLVTIALPIWLFLHWLNLRHWVWAVSLGAALTFAAASVFATESGIFWHMSGFSFSSGVDPMTLTDSELATQKWKSALLASVVLSVIGAAVGFIVWRIAYRPAPEAAPTSAKSQ